MRTLIVIEPKVLAQALYQLRDGLILVQIDVLVLDRTPESFYKDVVQGSSATVHADSDACLFQA
jgi:hypothetical protein